MSEEEQLPEEQWKRVRVSRSLKVRSEKMTQSNTYSPQGVRNTFRVPEGGMAIEVSNNKEISGGRMEKQIDFAICRRRANGEA